MLPGCNPWPEEIAKRYRSQGYWRGDTLGELLRASAERYGERTALIAENRCWTYAELDTRADRLAAGLQRLGIGARDRVVIHLPNVSEFVILCFALFRLGALPVMALPGHRQSEITYLCDYSEAVAYVIPDLHERFDYRILAEEVQKNTQTLKHVLVAGEPGKFVALKNVDADPVPLPLANPSDVAFFLLSGGTTGLPKLIPRTHDDYAYNIRACAEASGLDQNSVQLIVLPMAHNGALGCPGVMGSLRTGGKAVLAPSASPEEAFPIIERERITITTLVPPLALLWLEAASWTDVDLSSLRLMQIGGAKLNPEVAKRVRPTLGCGLQQWFGMAEGILYHTRLNDPEDVIVSTQGRPLSPADEIRVVDEYNRDLPPGELGELFARGPTTFRGYYKATKENATLFTPGGYLRTGDIVRITPSGHLIVEGRTKDVINRGGEKISAEEVENHLLAQPQIRNVAVVAMPDELMGERSCVFVIPRGEPPKLGDLTAFLRARGLAAYKLPDRLEIVDSFPQTSVGKVSKAELREAIARKLRSEQRSRQG